MSAWAVSYFVLKFSENLSLMSLIKKSLIEKKSVQQPLLRPCSHTMVSDGCSILINVTILAALGVTHEWVFTLSPSKKIYEMMIEKKSCHFLFFTDFCPLLKCLTFIIWWYHESKIWWMIVNIWNYETDSMSWEFVQCPKDWLVLCDRHLACPFKMT